MLNLRYQSDRQSQTQRKNLKISSKILLRVLLQIIFLPLLGSSRVFHSKIVVTFGSALLLRLFLITADFGPLTYAEAIRTS